MTIRKEVYLKGWTNVRIALVHDYLMQPGGAEAVLMVFKKIWPEAPVYTAYAFPKHWGRHKSILEHWDIRESWGKFLPFLPKFLSYYTVISPWFFTMMDLSGYDLVVISATGGYFPNGVRVGPNTKIVTYCHTPSRFLYGYPTATQARYKWYWRPISEVANFFLRMVDFHLAQRPAVIVVNSKNVANRVRKFYRRESVVVYPPIECKSLGSGEHKREDYYLIVSRIVGTKNINLAVEAANEFGFRLKIAGKPIGKSGEEIVKGMRGEKVEYLGEVEEAEKAKLLACARAFLALEKEADFGMTAVEPQAYGTPVIAYRNGGYLEAVVEGKTGIFFDELSPEGLGEAVREFEKLNWKKSEIKKWAAGFSAEKFEKKMLDLVRDLWRYS